MVIHLVFTSKGFKNADKFKLKCIKKTRVDCVAPFSEFVDKVQSVVRNMQSSASRSHELSNILKVHLSKLNKLEEKSNEMVKVAFHDIEMTRRQHIDTEKASLGPEIPIDPVLKSRVRGINRCYKSLSLTME